jgi:hypothetical protein
MRTGWLLRDPRDRWAIAAGCGHAALLVAAPSIPVVALGIWWTGNTIAHHFVHRPLFHARAANALWSCVCTLLLGVPQRLWRDRHLAHHAGTAFRLRVDAGLIVECALLAAACTALALVAPALLLWTWLPGIALGLAICAVHGHTEHLGGTTTCRARWWNGLFCNDGYHVEHHAHPRLHWRDLPATTRQGTRTSRLPPVLRILDRPWLDLLERVVVRSRPLQRLVLSLHRRPLARLIRDHAAAFAPVRRVVVVGGGLFPRTAILLAELLPDAQIVVLDANRRHLALAHDRLPPRAEVRCRAYTPGERLDADLVVLPLALRGERAACYASPPAPLVLVHDWLLRRRGVGVAIPLLGKRINLVRGIAGTRIAEAG